MSPSARCQPCDASRSARWMTSRSRMARCRGQSGAMSCSHTAAKPAARRSTRSSPSNAAGAGPPVVSESSWRAWSGGVARMRVNSSVKVASPSAGGGTRKSGVQWVVRSRSSSVARVGSAAVSRAKAGRCSASQRVSQGGGRTSANACSAAIVSAAGDSANRVPARSAGPTFSSVMFRSSTKLYRPASVGRDGRDMTTYRQLFANREFRVLFAGNALGVGAGTIQMLALAAWVYGRTGSPLLTVLAYLGGLLPYAIGAITVLSYADRVPPRGFLAAWDAVRAGTILVLALGALPIWSMIALVMATGFVQSVAVA